MAVENQYGMYGRSKLQAFPPQLAFPGNHGGRVRQIVDRVAAFSNGASVGSKFFMGRVHSGAVLCPSSTLWFGACGSSVTLNIGDELDDDALATLIAVASAGSSPIIEAAALVDSAGKRVWELLGRASDPNRQIDLIGTIAGADISTATGKFAWNIKYSND